MTNTSHIIIAWEGETYDLTRMTQYGLGQLYWNGIRHWACQNYAALLEKWITNARYAEYEAVSRPAEKAVKAECERRGIDIYALPEQTGIQFEIAPNLTKKAVKLEWEGESYPLEEMTETALVKLSVVVAGAVVQASVAAYTGELTKTEMRQVASNAKVASYKIAKARQGLARKEELAGREPHPN